MISRRRFAKCAIAKQIDATQAPPETVGLMRGIPASLTAIF